MNLPIQLLHRPEQEKFIVFLCIMTIFLVN